jgi:ketosteroid isomerase-like protein
MHFAKLAAAAVLIAFAGFAPAAHADDAASKKEILAAMDSWKHAMMTKDKAALTKIFADDLQYGHSTGEVQDKPTTVKRDLSSPNSYDAVEFGETKISVYGDAAVVTGKNTFRVTDAGKKRVIVFNALAVWVKSKQGWQLRARQVVKAP